MARRVLLQRASCTTRLVQALFVPSWTRRLFSSSKGIGSAAELSDNESNVRDEKQYPSYRSRAWSVSELDTLNKLVQESATEVNIAKTLGRSIHSVRGMRKNMARHSLGFLKARAEQLSRKTVNRPWSSGDISRMQDLFAHGHSAEYVSLQLDRTRRSVVQKHTRLRSAEPGRKFGKWSDEDVRRLQSFRAQGLSRADIASSLGRSSDSVRQRLYRLDHPIHQPHCGKHLTSAEDAQMVQLKQQGMKWSEIQARLPHRTYCSVRSRYIRMNLPQIVQNERQRPWTSREVSLLRDLRVRKVSIEEIAGRLQRSISSVEKKAYCEVLAADRVQQKWDNKAVEGLLEMRGRGVSWNDIAVFR